MQSCNNELHTNHISMEELDRVSAMDADDLNESDIALLQEIGQKMDSCSVCRARYLFYLDSEAALVLLTPKPIIVNTRIADVLREKIASMGTALNAADTALQEEISKWLESAQNVLGSFEQTSLRPAIVSGMRGFPNGPSEDTEITIHVPVGEDGFFEFELPKDLILTFRVKKETEFGLPVCLVVLGRTNKDFSAIYSLKSVSERAENLISGTIALQAGEYVLCVPTIKRDSD